MSIKAVLFDLIGTTVIENDPDTVVRCFEKAFTDHGVFFDRAVIQANRGKDKIEMIERVLKKAGASKELARPVFQSFENHFTNNLHNFSARVGAVEIITFLKRRNIKVGIGSGLSRDLFEKILSHIGWDQRTFDYVGIATEIGKSRPDPGMILDLMTKLRVTKGEVMKVGDTVADIQEGKNAGVMTVGVLAGTQPMKELERAMPDKLIRELDELKRLV